MLTSRRRRSSTTLLHLFAVALVAVLLVASCSNAEEGASDEGDGDGGSTDASGETTDGEPEVGEGPHGEFESISDVPGVTDDEIRIALLSTGEANPLGYCLLACQAEGIQAYFDWRNSQGGVNGRDLVLDVIDDEFGNNQARALEIIDGGEHFAVIGSPLLPDGFADLADAGVPVYASAVQSDIADGVENIFTSTGTLCITCAAPRLMLPAQDAGATKVAVLGLDAAQASKDCVAGTEASFEQFGTDLGITVEYVNDSLPFGLPNGAGPEVTAMDRAGIDFVATCLDQSSVLTIEREMDRQGMGDVPVVLPNAYGDDELLSGNADLLEGDYIGFQYRPLESDPAGTQLEPLVEWMGERDAAINDWAIISWINADLLFRGILAAGSQFDRQSVIDATNTFTGWTSGGLLGPIDWTRQHNAPTPDDVVTNGPVQDCFSWVKVEAGDVVLLGDEEKPQFCWDPKAEGYEDPMPSTFAE